MDHEEVEALRRATQQAVDATSTAYTEDASIDVEQRLREEMGKRGVDLDDEEWVAEVGRAIRSGHGITFDREPSGGNGG